MSSADRRYFALLGDPVAHSLSPHMHNAAFAAAGLAGVYGAIRCGATEVPLLMRALARAGGGGNVTVPHKRVALAELEHPRPDAATSGACNTFWAEADKLAGDNTDIAGLEAAIAELEPPVGGWLIVGTGGSARAVAMAASRAGVPIHVRSRSAGRAAEFLAWAATRGLDETAMEDCVLLINATPLGLAAGDPLPILPDAVPAAVAALDLVYARGGTRWVSALRRRGLEATDGRTVLVAQGAAAFERWWPGIGAPVEVMRKAVDAALA